MSIIGDHSETMSAHYRFSALEGKGKTVGRGKSFGLGRDPGKCPMSASVFLGSSSVATTQTSLFDGQKSSATKSRTWSLTLTCPPGLWLHPHHDLRARMIHVGCPSEPLRTGFFFLLSFFAFRPFPLFHLVDSSCIYGPHIIAVLVVYRNKQSGHLAFLITRRCRMLPRPSPCPFPSPS